MDHIIEKTYTRENNQFFIGTLFGRFNHNRAQILDITVMVILIVVLTVVLLLYRATQVPTIQEKASKVLNSLWTTEATTGTESLLFNKDSGFSFSDIIGTFFCYMNKSINYGDGLKFNAFAHTVDKMDFLFGKNKWKLFLYIPASQGGTSSNCFYFDPSGSMSGVNRDIRSIASTIDPTAVSHNIDSWTSCEINNGDQSCKGYCPYTPSNCYPVAQNDENWLGEAMDIANNPSLCGWDKNTPHKNLFLSSDELPGSCKWNSYFIKDTCYPASKDSIKRVVNCMNATVKALNKAGITVYYIYPSEESACNETEKKVLEWAAYNLSVRTGGAVIKTAEGAEKLKSDLKKYMGSSTKSFLIITSNSFKVVKLGSIEFNESLRMLKAYKSVDFVTTLPCRTDEFIRGTLFYYSG